MSETENGLIETWNMPNAASNSSNDCYDKGKIFYEQYLEPYIKTVRDCTMLECFTNQYNRTNGEIVNFENFKTYNIVLANGTVIGFFPHDTFVEIYTDLNGKKGPNKYGKDYFDIVISKTARNDRYGNYDKSGVYMFGQGKIRTQLTTGKYSCSKIAGTEVNGAYCGALIMHDGWKIEKDYPW